MTLKLLSYNIRQGGIGREQLIAEVIRSSQADVVVLQEAYDPEVIGKVADACGMSKWGARRGESVAFLSRAAVAGHSWHPLRFGKRAYLEVVLSSGTRVYGVHLSAIHSNVTEQRRVFELKSLLEALRRTPHGLHFVTGDFNTLAPGEELEVGRLPLRLRAVVWLTGRKIRWRTIQLMIDAGYTDGYRLFHTSDDGYTFPVWDPHVRLDYVFVPSGLRSFLRSCDILRHAPDARRASDHFPLLMQITDR